MGEMIQFNGSGDIYQGYLAVPADTTGPALIVLQEWWGLVDHIKDVCDRLAVEGFVALAPDLYRGDSTKDPDEAGTLMQALNIAETETILSRAVEAVMARKECSSAGAGIIGFCMGGQLALFAAGANPKIVACVDFYGIHPKVQPSFRNLNGPVLGIFADGDHMTDPEAVKALDRELTLLEKPHEFHSYDADHAFFNDTRPEVYDSQAAADAWQKTITFLQANVA